MPKAATLEQADSLNVDIQSLQLVRDSVRDEIHNLHGSRVTLQGSVESLRKDIREMEIRKKIELTKQNSEFHKEMETKRAKLYLLEKNLEVIQTHLSDRERSVASREKKVADLEQKKIELYSQSLIVERLRIQVKRESDELQAEKTSVSSRVAIATKNQADAHLRLAEAKKHRDSVINREIGLNDRVQVVLQRERTVDQAVAALEPKLAGLDVTKRELDERETGLKVKAKVLADWDRDLKAEEVRLSSLSRKVQEAKIVQEIPPPLEPPVPTPAVAETLTQSPRKPGRPKKVQNA